MLTTINIKISGTRAEIRKELINVFLKEKPGAGKGALCSKYIYNVETCKKGKILFLQRPANFNNGFDFTINVSNTKFPSNSGKRSSTKPTHNNIITDLEGKKKENATEFKKVQKLIKKIYECKNVSDATMRKLKFNSGYDIEIILKAIKWLFIEQDVTYWNYSGRAMLYTGIKAI